MDGPNSYKKYGELQCFPNVPYVCPMSPHVCPYVMFTISTLCPMCLPTVPYVCQYKCPQFLPIMSQCSSHRSQNSDFFGYVSLKCKINLWWWYIIVKRPQRWPAYTNFVNIMKPLNSSYFLQTLGTYDMINLMGAHATPGPSNLGLHLQPEYLAEIDLKRNRVFFYNESK